MCGGPGAPRTVGWGREGLRHALTPGRLCVPAWGGGATGPVRGPGPEAAREWAVGRGGGESF